MNIIQKLKKSCLIGRSGSGFLTGAKWEIVKKQKSDKKYIICNASEGELSVFKDEYLLRNYPEEVINGIKIALKTFPESEAYIYLRKDLYDKLGIKLKKIINKEKIKLFRETGGYLCGEETTLISSMEGCRDEPKIKPPYPPTHGLWGKPTLVNNVETFYYVSKIANNEYKKTRFVCISKNNKKLGIFEVSVNSSVKKILQETKTLPKNKFFVQVGGGACGEIMPGKNLNKPMCGIGSIVIYDDNMDVRKLMKKWINFYIKENCGKCAPCREGVYRIKEVLDSNKKIDWKLVKDILETMQLTSFCGLGTSMPTSFLSLMKLKCLK
ncbi:hypothetical protein HOD96_02055 [Candidatus Falkowbacteria bacterium]|jgi:NADH:ubiquinone oxidoreductase subunit F (NADH-binding)|nr:hypothetical protein [Candidatus Falkowbacteria bacterium]MBT4433074.1 hypothetical protein [Candidatus Falkowbacteria bacterium]